MIGETLGGYRLLKLLGRGGMGEVYLAEHERLKVQYAVKVLPQELSVNPEFVKRFYTEARVMASLEHPHIVKVVNLGEEKGTYYLVMDYVEREQGRPSDLRELLEAGGGRLRPDTAMGILTQGVIHRDLKPANVLMDAEGQVKVTDFGLAKVVGGDYLRTRVQQSVARSVTLGAQPDQDREASSGLSTQQVTATYALLGTYDYMSPEQKLGRDVDGRSDIYALGVLMQTLLTGEKPVGAFKYPSEAIRGVSRRWDSVVRRCLQEAPGGRYQSVAELAGDLEAIGRRSRAKAAAAVVALLAVIMGAVYLVYRLEWQSPPVRPQVANPPPAVAVHPAPQPPLKEGPAGERPAAPQGRPIGLAEAAEAKATMEVAHQRVSSLEATGRYGELFDSARQAALVGQTLLEKDSHAEAASRFQAATDIYGQVEAREGQYQGMLSAQAKADSARLEAEKAEGATYADEQYGKAEGYRAQAGGLAAQRDYLKASGLFAQAEAAYREAQRTGEEARAALAAKDGYDRALAAIGLTKEEAGQLAAEVWGGIESARSAAEVSFQNRKYTEAKQGYEQAAQKVSQSAVAFAGLRYAEAVRLLNGGEAEQARNLRQKALLLDASLGDWQKHPEFFAPAKSAWPMFRGGPRRTGRSPHNGPQVPKIKWTAATGGSIESSAAVGDDGTVYIGSGDGNFYAVSPSGAVKWRVTAGDKVRSSPAVAADGTVYVGSDDGNLYAISPSGEVKWKLSIGRQIRSSPLVAEDGTVYVGGRDGSLYAVTPTGQARSEVKTGDVVGSSPAVSSDGTVYVGSFDDNVYAVGPAGEVKWKVLTGGDVQSTAAIGEDGTLYVGGWDRTLYALTPAGQLTWKVNTDSPVFSSPAVGADGTIYVGLWDGNLYAVTPSGSVRWKLKLGGPIYSSPAVCPDGTICVGALDGNLYAVTASGGVRWQIKAGSGIWSSPALAADGTIYVGSDDGKLYAIGE
jgi:outer membrane protein assembly factor BamB